ncbi:MAG: hypothetical protein A2087_09800 [Spirochaetes bacterium GWD1_61_31]|nr:MAG: hypothetical protein A2Y37_12515 [Spirochaetes bacterium GWB1_60_80]OHD41219.1 MAG: hypothetical protein A2087_09800 [Spirochaetes bacterium GWD1_61_31]OHD45117.1 MAG: hypothetical protein A2Y35_09590 [Spirochaetes bacterium GWE1_60_18]
MSGSSLLDWAATVGSDNGLPRLAPSLAVNSSALTSGSSVSAIALTVAAAGAAATGRVDALGSNWFWIGFGTAS